MTVELISVGTEILLGNIVNTNAAYLSEKCAGLGLSCFFQTVVGDNAERLKETIETACGRSDIVILSGGLGPTEDDLTKETVADVFQRKLIMDERTHDRIAEYFQRLDKEPTVNNWKQGMVPEGCIVIDNDNGTAPGIVLKNGEKHVILLPGPPNELIPMFEKDIKPYIEALQPGIIYSQTVKICGIGESRAATIAADLMEEQTNPTMAPYAKSGEVHMRVTAKAENEKDAKKLVKPLVKELKVRFGENVYTTEEDVTLEQAVVDLLKNNKLTASTVESCTGGLLSARIVNVPGVSEVFKGGHVTYSNKSKHRILGIKKNIINKNGAVSEIVAREMAKGTALLNKTDVVVSVTGLAGPDGGTEGKPVGLVYIGCYVKGEVTVQEYHFSGNRAKIRESAVSEALILMRKCILSYCENLK